MQGSIEKYPRLATGLLCASAAALYLGSEARAAPEWIFFCLALAASLVLPASLRARLPAGLWTALLLALFALEGTRAWRAPGDLPYCLFELVRWLLVAKLWTRASGRDELQILLLSFFVLLGGAVFTYSFQLSAFLLLYLLVAPAALLLASAAGLDDGPAGAGARALPPRVYALGAVAGLLIFVGGALIFFTLPRLSAALVQFDVGRAGAERVFPLEVDPGRGSLLRPSGRVVFRVRVEPPLLGSPLWRVMALDEFDGATWRAPRGGGTRLARLGEDVFVTDPSAWRRGAGREFRFELSPIDLPALLVPSGPALPNPPSLAIFGPFSEVVLAPGDRLGFSTRRDEPAAPLPLEYGVATPPEGQGTSRPAQLLAAERRRLTRLPSRLDPRMGALASELARAAPAADPWSRARGVERYLSENFTYSLKRRASDSGDPLAEFLFGDRIGHCEYFASAAATLLRLQGIPARVVSGFASGQWSPEESSWTIRESDAHSWVEAYAPGRGWFVVDPSPRDLAAEHASFGRWALAFEDWRQRTEFWWYQWVLQYSFAEQVALAGRLSGSAVALWPWAGGPRGPRGPAAPPGRYPETALLALLAALALVAVLGPLLWRRRRQSRLAGLRGRSSLAALLRPLYREARHRGAPCPAGVTPLGLSQALDGHLPPESAARLRAWVMAYNRARYGALVCGPETRRGLRRQWREVRRELRRPGAAPPFGRLAN